MSTSRPLLLVLHEYYCSIVFDYHAGSISGYILDKRHNTHNLTTHNTTTHTIQHNTKTTPFLVIFTYKTMAEVLGAVASAMAVVQVAGKVWSTGWKYYEVRIPPSNLSHNQ